MEFSFCMFVRKGFFSAFRPDVWTTLSHFPLTKPHQTMLHWPCRGLSLIPWLCFPGAGSREGTAAQSSNKPLSLSRSYLNIWRSGIKSFLDVPFPSFPKVYFSTVMSWGLGFWHCSRSNMSEQHIEGSAPRQGLCERNLYPSVCSTLWWFTGNSLRKQNFWSLVEVWV